MERSGDRNLQGFYIPQALLREISKVGNRLLIGIPCERNEGERRLALTPEAVHLLIERGHQVWVETGAGLGINYSDNHYSEAGADILQTSAEVFQADIILKVLPPSAVEVSMMKTRATILSFTQFNMFSQDAYELMIAKRITALSYEFIADESSRYPILSLISEIEGATSVSIASELLSNAHGGKGVLLGGIPGVSPTEVVIIGAGNAGTVAARAAMALGASVKVFDDDIQKLRVIQQVLGQGLFTSTFHPNVLKNALHSADVTIGAMRYIDSRDHFFISEDLIRTMKQGAVIIDLRINQGGCFETTCGLPSHEPEIFEQYGVLHYCRQNISNHVARTTSMAMSNIILPLFYHWDDLGALSALIKSDRGVKNGVYMYCGKPVNSFISHYFNFSSNNIDLYLSAF